MADLHTKVPGARPLPNRTKFFCFYICFHRKAPVSEVGAPSNEGWPPPTGNPGSAPAHYGMTKGNHGRCGSHKTIWFCIILGQPGEPIIMCILIHLELVIICTSGIWLLCVWWTRNVTSYRHPKNNQYMHISDVNNLCKVLHNSLA